jgi:hypothetical protein
MASAHAGERGKEYEIRVFDTKTLREHPRRMYLDGMGVKRVGRRCMIRGSGGGPWGESAVLEEWR